jgi:hypothetical protein
LGRGQNRRKNDARFIIDLLVESVSLRKKLGKTASYVLNIDGEWGSGKSFFLSRLAQQLKAEGYLVAQVNAWRDDHSDDPLVAMMAEIDKVVNSPPPKGGGFRLRLKAGSVRRSADLA